jgi:hypothetical protein
MNNKSIDEDVRVAELREAMKDPLFLEDLYEVMEDFKFNDYQENNNEDYNEESRSEKGF